MHLYHFNHQKWSRSWFPMFASRSFPQWYERYQPAVLLSNVKILLCKPRTEVKCRTLKLHRVITCSFSRSAWVHFLWNASLKTPTLSVVGKYTCAIRHATVECLLSDVTKASNKNSRYFVTQRNMGRNGLFDFYVVWKWNVYNKSPFKKILLPSLNGANRSNNQ